ncbi:TIR domain-containing protein [Mycobacterium asiaticum]|uniref:TIR domain-containing protein n=1 Tax=Mycobacterium asiaticum TaxID=1790 RepID=UPI0009BCC388|nr:TIR domain-containing protein [Mycobacterium asiaticum]
MSALHNVFISHRHEDDRFLSQLRDLLARHGCEIHDSSVNSSNPNGANSESYIKSILADRIQRSGKIIVLVSPDTKNHEWVDWEIEYANRFPDKRIIGVWAPGAAQCDLPSGLEEFADAVVGWNGQAIIDALNGADRWETPDGSVPAARSIPRAKC